MMKIEYVDEPKAEEAERVKFEFSEICIGGGFAVSARRQGRAEHYNGEYVKASDYDSLKAQFAHFLKVAGAVITADGDLVFSSEGYGQWTRRKGDARTKEIAAENERLTSQLATARQDADVMLNNAQALRIQQSQATATWEQHYRDKGDAAWKAINEAHRRIAETGAPIPNPPVRECQHDWQKQSDKLYSCGICSKSMDLGNLGELIVTRDISTEAAQGCECENCRDERRMK